MSAYALFVGTKELTPLVYFVLRHLQLINITVVIVILVTTWICKCLDLVLFLVFSSSTLEVVE